MASVRPYRYQGRKNHWECAVSLGPDPDRPGRYLKKSFVLCPASCDLGCSPFPGYRARTEKEAHRAADEIAKRLRSGADTKRVLAASPSFASIVDDWIRWLTDEGKSRNTLHSYRGLADRHLIPTFGDRPATGITTPELQVHIDALRLTLSPASCGRVVTVARQAFGWAVRRGLVATNPARDVQRPAQKKRQVVMPVPDDVIRALEALSQEARWLEVFALVVASTGARRGEVCALRWGDVARGAIVISGSINRWREHGPTKTGESRTVELGALALDALTTWHDQQLGEAREIDGMDIRALPDDWYVFPSDDGPTIPRNPDAITRQFARVRERHGLPRVWFHGLRHHAASTLLLETDPVKVAKILGHSSTKLTLDTYGHQLGSHREAIDRLDRALRAPDVDRQ